MSRLLTVAFVAGFWMSSCLSMNLLVGTGKISQMQIFPKQCSQVVVKRKFFNNKHYHEIIEQMSQIRKLQEKRNTETMIGFSALNRKLDEQIKGRQKTNSLLEKLVKLDLIALKKLCPEEYNQIKKEYFPEDKE